MNPFDLVFSGIAGQLHNLQLSHFIPFNQTDQNGCTPGLNRTHIHFQITVPHAAGSIGLFFPRTKGHAYASINSRNFEVVYFKGVGMAGF